MSFVVFDTETTSLDKPFVYNIGYAIFSDNFQELVRHDFVVEQIWHNLPLFSSAYYADKRPIYIGRMRSRQVIMDKFGYICKLMRKEFKEFGVTDAYAYNSKFDERVFDFNCDWFKVINPFEQTPIFDIRGYVHCFMIDKSFTDFCEENSLFSETGNYSTSAQTLFRYVSKDTDFEEEHTALSDSLIEAQILQACIDRGAQFGVAYKTKISIERKIEKELKVITRDKEEHLFRYEKITISKDKQKITLK